LITIPTIYDVQQIYGFSLCNCREMKWPKLLHYLLCSVTVRGMQWRQWIWKYLWSDINDAILCVRQIVYMNKNGGF